MAVLEIFSGTQRGCILQDSAFPPAAGGTIEVELVNIVLLRMALQQ